VALLGSDARPLLGRVVTQPRTVITDDAKRERVADADHQHRHSVARHDDDEEMNEGRRVGRIARSALGRGWLIDDIRQRTDRGRTGSARPQPRTCMRAHTPLLLWTCHYYYFIELDMACTHNIQV